MRKVYFGILLIICLAACGWAITGKALYLDGDGDGYTTLTETMLQHVTYDNVGETITQPWTFNVGAGGTAPFVVGTQSQNNLVSGLNSDRLDGQEGSYYLDWGNLTNTPTPTPTPTPIPTATPSSGDNSNFSTAGQIYDFVTGYDPAQTVTVGASNCDYTTIQGAIDSITDSSSSKRYVVLVYPGTYDENVTLKDYVDLVGKSKTSCIIQGDGSAYDGSLAYTSSVTFIPSTSLLANITVINTRSSYPSMCVGAGVSFSGGVASSKEIHISCVDMVSGDNDTFGLYGATNTCSISNCDLTCDDSDVLGNYGGSLKCQNLSVIGSTSPIWCSGGGKTEIFNSVFYTTNSNDHVRLSDVAGDSNSLILVGCSFLDDDCITLGNVIKDVSGSGHSVILRDCFYADRNYSGGDVTFTIQGGERSATDLTVGDDATITGALDVSGDSTIGNLYTDNSVVQFFTGSPGIFSLGSTVYCRYVDSTQKWEWSGNGTVYDTNIYRDAANSLKTDDAFDANSLEIGGTEVISSSRVVSNVTIPATAVEINEIGTALKDDVQDWMNVSQSAGVACDPTITDGGSGTVDIGSGCAYIRSTDSEIGEIYAYSFTGTTGLSLTDNSNNWIYIRYDATTPTYHATTDLADIDFNTEVLIGQAWREGTTVKTIQSGPRVSDTAYRTARRAYDLRKVEVASGIRLAETGTRNFSVSAGTTYYGTTKQTYSAQDTNVSDTFTYHYHSSGVWASTASQTAINNTQYDNGTNLALLSNNKYGVHWVAMDFSEDLHVVYGVGDYTLQEAQEAQIPADLPDIVDDFGFIIGKIIIEQNASTFTAIESVATSRFTTSAATDHNNLINLQGGTTDEYYHLTSTQHTNLTGGDFGNLNVGIDTANTITSTDTNGDIIFDPNGTGNIYARFPTTGGIQVQDSDDSNSRRGIIATNSSGGYIAVGSSTVSTTALIRGFAESGIQGYFTSGNMGFGTNTPAEDVHASDTVRADTAFNLNGTDGLSTTKSWTDGDGNTHNVTISGGIITAWTITAP